MKKNTEIGLACYKEMLTVAIKLILNLNIYYCDFGNKLI